MKENKKVAKVVRVYNWKMTDQEVADAFARFQKIAAYRGNRPDHELSNLIEKFNNEAAPSFTLVSEAELVRQLNFRKLGLSRQQLKYLRDHHQLKDSEGKRIWYTDGYSIVYNLEAVIEYEHARRQPK